MEISEVSKLIPLYVAGSLSDQERRAVEEALAGSAELRKELEFWKQAQIAARLYDPTHPSAEAIVNYAEGKVAGQEHLTLELHLQQCADCRHELEIVRETYPVAESMIDERRSTDEVNVLELFREFFRTIRTGYLMPASVLVVLGVFLVVVLYRTAQVPDAVAPRVQEPKLIALVLDYTTQLRSTGKQQLTRLIVPDTIDAVSLTLRIPRSIEAARYAVEFTPPSGLISYTQDSINASQYDESLDQITAIIKRSYFRSTGTYRVRVTERLPSVSALTSESYLYSFVVADSTGAR